MLELKSTDLASKPFVGPTFGDCDLLSCIRFAEGGLGGVSKEREDQPLLLITSDMIHFAPEAENRRFNAITLGAQRYFDPVMLYETVTKNRISRSAARTALGSRILRANAP